MQSAVLENPNTRYANRILVFKLSPTDRRLRCQAMWGVEDQMTSSNTSNSTPLRYNGVLSPAITIALLTHTSNIPPTCKSNKLSLSEANESEKRRATLSSFDNASSRRRGLFREIWLRDTKRKVENQADAEEGGQ